MEEKTLLKRLHELEEAVERLKSELSAENRKSAAENFRKLALFTLAYWPLLSFLTAIGIAFYVKWAFGVDYFENYRSLATTRDVSEFYRSLGDTLLQRQEWEAAEEAYQQSVEVNRNNTAASYGIVKARVFQPLKDQRYTIPEVTDAKLEYLLAKMPDDADVAGLKAYREWERQDYDSAMKWSDKALALNPKLVSAHNLRAYIHQGNNRLPDAIKELQAALAIQPDQTLALNNLGFLQLLTGDYAKAEESLNRSLAISPNLLTALNLSDTLRYQDRNEEALGYRKSSQQIANSMASDEKDRFWGGQWTYNYMPLRAGDVETIQQNVRVSTIPQKRAIIEIGLAIDEAMTGDKASSVAACSKWREYDPEGVYAGFFLNKILSTMALAKPSAAAVPLLRELHDRVNQVAAGQ